MSLVRAADPSAIEEAARLIRNGRLVAFPTETVYGLGCDATNADAVAAVFEAKDRPRFNPMIIHVPDVDAAGEIVAFDDRARALADAFWPGPLTLVLPRREDCPVAMLAGAGLETLAVRAPAHPTARDFLRACAKPVAAPSANPSGTLSPTAAVHVAEALGDKIELILDGGPCSVGVESTVVGLVGEKPVLLRPGGVAAEDIEAVVGPLFPPAPGPAASPGMQARHYAPSRPIRPNARWARPDEALLAFGPELPPYAPDDALNLSPSGDLKEAAANLFDMLRRLDREPYQAIAVSPIPNQGLGRAINDRLRRAAVAAPDEDAQTLAGGCKAVVDPFELGD